MGEKSKTRERPTMGRIREVEAEVASLREQLTEATSADTHVSMGEVVTLDTEYVSIPVADLSRVLDEMREAMTSAHEKAQGIKAKAKPSYADNLHRRFLEGTSKTSAYFLEKLSKVVES